MNLETPMQPRATSNLLCELILAATQERQRKIAMVAFLVRDDLQKLGLSATPQDFDACIEFLAGSKFIQTFGNTKRWRFSEACHNNPLPALDRSTGTPANTDSILPEDWQSQ